MTIRPARPGDEAALHEVATETFPHACPPGTSPKAIAQFIRTTLSVERFAEYLADPARAVLAADGDGRLDGYTLLVVGEPTDADVAAAITTRPTAELSKLYVRPDVRGAGLAARLVDATIAEAAERGASAVWLGVNQRNERANRFYDKNRFAKIGTKRFLVGDEWHDDFVRERVL